MLKIIVSNGLDHEKRVDEFSKSVKIKKSNTWTEVIPPNPSNRESKGVFFIITTIEYFPFSGVAPE